MSSWLYSAAIPNLSPIIICWIETFSWWLADSHWIAKWGRLETISFSHNNNFFYVFMFWLTKKNKWNYHLWCLWSASWKSICEDTLWDIKMWVKYGTCLNFTLYEYRRNESKYLMEISVVDSRERTTVSIKLLKNLQKLRDENV